LGKSGNDMNECPARPAPGAIFGEMWSLVAWFKSRGGEHFALWHLSLLYHFRLHLCFLYKVRD